MENAANGKSTMSSETIRQIGLNAMSAVARQFGGGNKRDEFDLACPTWVGQLVSFGSTRTSRESVTPANNICNEHDDWRHR